MRIVALDTLRGLAALAVAVPHFLVAHHIHPVFFQAVSIVSVEVFFVLSGFVLAPQILQCVKSGSQKNLLVFYCRRWMRTLPPYVIALCVVAMLTSNLYTQQFLRYLFFAQNLGSIDASNDFFPVAWSLSIEEWFYLLFPIFLLVLTRVGCGILRACAIFIAVFFAFKLAGAALYPDWDTVARRLVIFRLDSIAFGFLLYLFLSPFFTSNRARLLYFVFLGLASVAMIWTMASVYSNADTAVRFSYFYVSALFSGSLIMVFYANNDAFLKWNRATRVSTFFATISYDIYLFHIPVMLVIDRFLAPPVGLFVLYLVGVLGLSCLIRLTIEDRILAARPSYLPFQHDQLSSAEGPDKSAGEVGRLM
jgi:peptidoglycan/LPS O-acetylase OafA/YrhL